MLDNLTKDVLAAEKAGMSYGQWKAMHPKTKAPSKRTMDDAKSGKIYRKCIVCGKRFEVEYYNQVLCSDECRRERNRQHNSTYQEKYRAMHNENKEG